MAGGTGNDTYLRDNVFDVITESAGQGTDTVQSTVTYVLGANLENLTLTGAGHINGTGNGLINVLTGNSGHNVLNGGAGNDAMAGGAGNDTYVRNAAGDVVTELAGQGTDTVQSFVTYTLGANLERLTLIGAGNVNGTGNALVNIVTGNAGNNTLNGSGGADTLRGLGGNDTIIWDAVDTQVDGGAGTDTLRINGAGQVLNLQSVANDKILNVEVINITGSGNNSLTVNLEDVLELSSTTNTLRVDGNAGDSFQRGDGWTQGANQIIGANSYFRYTQSGATLLVDTDISAGT
jgi:Ca2+-binding RTX toxin-like protein